MFTDTSSAIPLPYVAGPGAVHDASTLLATFGAGAGQEAAARAERSRDQGNALQFCHWRQIERLVVLLASETVMGSLH